MNKFSVCLLSSVMLISFTSCASGTDKTSGGNANSASVSEINSLENIKKNYGDFSVTADDSSYTYTLSGNVLTLSSVGTYTLTGYFNGKIVYSLDDTEAKGNTGTIILNSCYIESGTEIAIEWTSKKGTLELKSEKDSVNYIISEGDLDNKHQAIKCNNLDFRGSGETFIKCYNHNAIKAQDVDVRKSILTIEAGKNGISCENITFKSGDITIQNCVKGLNVEIDQDDDPTGLETGYLTCVQKTNDDGTVDPLTVTIKNCDAAFKVESLVDISYGQFNVSNCLVLNYAEGVTVNGTINQI